MNDDAVIPALAGIAGLVAKRPFNNAAAPAFAGVTGICHD